MAGNDYRIIYADPPWKWCGYNDRIGQRSIENHYNTMSIDNLKAMPIVEMAAPDAVLFIWVVQSILPPALEIIEAWGFTFKTVAFAWVKLKHGQDRLFYAGDDVKMGMGYHTRAGFEQCWLATRGNGYKRLAKGEPQVVFAPRREHSRKPDEVADAIVRLCGDLPRIELFARTRRPGWDAWGNEVDKFGGASVLQAPINV